MAKLPFPYTLYPHRQNPQDKGTTHCYWSPLTDPTKKATTEAEAIELAQKMLSDNPELYCIKINFKQFKTKDAVHVTTILQPTN